MSKQRILSGVQASGVLHIGNYLGAIKQWVAFQEDFDAFYSIVDLHAITVRQAPDLLRKNVLTTAKLLLAVGLDPKKCVLFVQSHVSAHTEVSWVLGTLVKIAELERMTQFKDKAQTHSTNINSGLLTYPVLMAADILLYQTHFVPVGEDQEQHIELTRTLARRFNNIFEEVFVVPEGKYVEHGARIMGLDDPQTKMSKSAPSPNNFISLLDPEKDVRKKIARAVTDSTGTIVYDEDRKAMANLMTIYHALTGMAMHEITEKYQGKGYAEFKKDLADIVVDFLKPIHKAYDRLSDHDVEEILEKGTKKAAKVANETRDRVYEAIGLR